MKKLMILFVLTVVILTNVIVGYAVEVKPISVVINGENIVFDTNPIIQDGVTLVPMRKIFEKLGASVTWEPINTMVTCTKGSTKIALKIGSNIATVNGKSVQLAVAAKILNGRTMVPLRFISESLGAKVNWNETSKLIKIENINVLSQYSASNSAIEIINKCNFIQKDDEIDVMALQKELENVKDINGEALFTLPPNMSYGVYDKTIKEAVFQLQMFLEMNGYLVMTEDAIGNKKYSEWDLATQKAYVTYKLDPDGKQFYFNAKLDNTWPEVMPIQYTFGRNDIMYFSQRDLRWAHEIFSNHGDKTQTIGMSGCGPTSMSIIISTLLGKEVTPIDTCAYAISNGFRSYDNGVPHDSGFYESIASFYKIKSKKISLSSVKNSINEGKIVLALMKPSHFTGGGHYIVFDKIVNINGKEYISVLDPNHCNENYGNDGKVIDYIKNDGAVLTTVDLIKAEGIVFMEFWK